jgi:hypothetical protein
MQCQGINHQGNSICFFTDKDGKNGTEYPPHNLIDMAVMALIFSSIGLR